MHTPRLSSTQPSFHKPSPRNNVHKLSYSIESLQLDQVDTCDPTGPPVHLRTKTHQSIHNNRSNVKALEEWTHSSLAAVYKQEETQNINVLQRHTHQIEILDQSMNKLADLIKTQCSDQASLLLKLWSSAADLYSIVFQSLTKSVQELNVQVADRTIEAAKWEEKYRALKKQYAEEKSTRSHDVGKNNVLRQREEEILLKEKEMLELQDLVTSLSIWFPSFPKFGKSVLSRYLPPLTKIEDPLCDDVDNTNSVSIDKGDSLTAKLKLAQSYLCDDLKRLEYLGIGLRIVCSSDVNNLGVSSPFGVSVVSQSVVRSLHDGNSDITNMQCTDRQYAQSHLASMLHLQELEAQLIKQQDDFDARLMSLERELQHSQRREKVLREQLSAIQKQTRSVMHCLPSMTFSPCSHGVQEHKLLPTNQLSKDCLIKQLISFLDIFSGRFSIYQLNPYSSWTFDNFSNAMNGQAIQLASLTPMKIFWDGKLLTSSRLCSLLCQYFHLKCGRSRSSFDRFNAFLWSVMNIVTGEGQEDSEFSQFLKLIFDIGVDNDLSELCEDRSSISLDRLSSTRDAERTILLVYWYRSMKSGIQSDYMIPIQAVAHSLSRMFRSPLPCLHQDKSVFQNLIEDGQSESRPCWYFISTRRQRFLITSVKSEATLLNDKPVVSVFTVFNKTMQAVVAFRKKILDVLQNLFDFVESIVTIDPANTIFMHLILSCLLVNPLRVVMSQEEISDFDQLPSSIQFSHELNSLFSQGNLTRETFATLVYEIFSNIRLTTLVELMEHAESESKLGSILMAPLVEVADNDNSTILILREKLECAGRLYLKFLMDFTEEDSFKEKSSNGGSRFRKDVREALTLFSRRSRFADCVELQLMLQQSIYVENENCLERLLIHARLNFEPTLRIGLVANLSSMWFTLTAMMGLLPPLVNTMVKDCLNGSESLRRDSGVLIEDPTTCVKMKFAERYYRKMLMSSCFAHWRTSCQKA